MSSVYDQSAFLRLLRAAVSRGELQRALGGEEAWQPYARRLRAQVELLRRARGDDPELMHLCLHDIVDSGLQGPTARVYTRLLKQCQPPRGGLLARFLPELRRVRSWVPRQPLDVQTTRELRELAGEIAVELHPIRGRPGGAPSQPKPVPPRPDQPASTPSPPPAAPSEPDLTSTTIGPGSGSGAGSGAGPGGAPAASVASSPDLPDACLLYTSPSPRDQRGTRMPSSA